MQYLIIALIAVTIAIIVWINYGFKITEHTLEYENLPVELDGFKIVLISDLHDSTFGKNNSRLLAAIKAISPDMVALAGDMHGKTDDGEYLSFLSALCNDFPVYAVDGNHEKYWHTRTDYGEYLQRYLATGVNHLTGDSHLIAKNGATLRIYGIGYHEYEDGRAERPDGTFSIAILHVPDWFDRIEAKPDLTLSGHVHGGVVRLPGIGGIFAPGYGASIIKRFGRKFFFPKYSKGIYSHGDSRLAVTVGLGRASIQPFRFLRPEIMVITLKSAAK